MIQLIPFLRSSVLMLTLVYCFVTWLNFVIIRFCVGKIQAVKTVKLRLIFNNYLEVRCCSLSVLCVCAFSFLGGGGGGAI